ncbi:MAG: radical SAM protein [Candidatus Muiribacterium halophilum]|uniref:Radical SAM protein n=1 Tax=Muiribacterium halophilum TaxID=2053465 RepID=A0A2N5ZE15_MUIH1|nr:MAG: radical SAM protein [Candidatus Muirbacterium halophilum]
MYPKYIELIKDKKRLNELIDLADRLWESCELCGRRCRIDRNKKTGPCLDSKDIKVASFAVHNGEEPPISGNKGAGNVFFSGCSLNCEFCQNYPISQLFVGNELSIDEFTEKLIKLQKKGVHNINLVTATHLTPLVFKGIIKAAELGLNIPIIYNSSGYDTLQNYSLLREFVDVFLPDVKYIDDGLAKKYSNIKDYNKINIDLIKAINKDNPENIYEDGMIKKGLVIRHLVLPFEIDNTYKVIDELINIDKDMTLSVMNQYFPAFNRAEKTAEKLDSICYNRILDYIVDNNMENVWIQEE